MLTALSLSAFLIASLLLNTSAESSWLSDHIFAVTDKAPLSRAFNSDDRGKIALEGLLDYYRAIEKDVGKSTPVEKLRGYVLPNSLEYVGLPPLSVNKQILYDPDKHRSTAPAESEKRREAERKRTDRLFFKNVIDFNDAVQRTGDAVNKSTGLNWARYIHYGRIDYESVTRSDFCLMYTNLAFRVNGIWAIDATLTNDFRHIFKRDGDRRYVSESLYLNQTSGRVQSLNRWLNLSLGAEGEKYWTGTDVGTGTARTRTSTILSIWSGRPGVSHFYPLIFEDINAFHAAISIGKYLNRQALDSKAPSNAAILLFPLLMTVVPIALFVDCSNIATLAYMIFTDVLSVLPLLIKGIELLIAGTSRHFSMRTMVYGKPAAKGTVLAETWAVECKTHPNLTKYGAAFVTIALAAMILGIVLEFVTKALVKRNYPFLAVKQGDSTVEHIWRRYRPCGECQCYGTPPGDDCSQTSGSSVGGLLGQIRRRRDDCSIGHMDSWRDSCSQRTSAGYSDFIDF